MTKKKLNLFPLKIGVSIILAITISYYGTDYLMKEQAITPVSDDEKNSEEFLTAISEIDLKKIKEDIELINNPPPPPEPEPEPPAVTVPPQNPTPPINPPSPSGSVKEIFQRNKAMIIGNSFVEGMTAYGVLYPSNAIWSRGIRIDNMDSQLEQAIQYHPNILILSYGTNDILSWSSNVNAFINAYRTKLQQIKASLPNTSIYICAILPVNPSVIGEKPAFQYINLYNQELASLANEFGIMFLDSGYLLNPDPSYYEFDGIHPKGFFYPKWAADIINKIGMR